MQKTKIAPKRKRKQQQEEEQDEQIMRSVPDLTRKLCYRKDDHAMRPMFRLFYSDNRSAKSPL